MIIISLKLLLTMCFGCLATGPSNLTVIQTPTKINISTGDYTEITCFWEKDIIMRYRVSWYLVSKANITERVSSKVVYVSNITRENKDVLVIKSAKVNDTGFYYCEMIIEIPFYKKLCGNGTTVIVEEKEADSPKKTDLVIWAIVPFLVAVGGLYLCYKKKQFSTLSGAAQPLVLTERREEEQMLEVAELHGRNESTREAAEENSSCNSAEWFWGCEGNLVSQQLNQGMDFILTCIVCHNNTEQFSQAVSTLYESLEFFCNESGGEDDKSTATIVSNAACEQIPQTRAAENSRMTQGSAVYFDIQN